MTYSKLANSVKRFAGRFDQLGIKKGQIVGVSLRPEFEVVVDLALLQIGAVSLTATPSVTRNYKEELDFLIVQEMQIGFSQEKQILIDELFLDGLGAVASLSSITELADEDIVRLVFSSGTTGVPKGIEFTKSNLISRTQSARENWMPADPFMSLLGLDTVTGMQTFYWSVFNGKTYLSPSSAENNLSLISDYMVKAMKSSPAKLSELLVALKNSPKALSLEVVEVAGSLLTRRVAEMCLSLTGIVPLYLYGSTEVGTVTKGLFKTEQPENVGSKVDDVQFEVIDERIRYRKENMPKSYWLNPDTGNSGFQDGWFYPGDLGFVDENSELHLVGRIDDLVNAGGAKFNLLELDTWLKESNLFDDVASFNFIDPHSETKIGIAFVSAQPPIPEILTSRIRDFLPNLNVSLVIRLKELPRNKLDKIDRKELQRICSAL